MADAPDDDTTTTTTAEPTPFFTLLREHRGGGMAIDLTDVIAEVVDAVHEHDKTGSVTLTLKFEPAADGVQVVLYDEIKKKVPEAAPLPSLFFVREGGQLSRRDPRQPEIPGLRDAADPSTARAAGQEG